MGSLHSELAELTSEFSLFSFITFQKHDLAGRRGEWDE